MEFLFIGLFALAVSADGFMVGLAYGVWRIRIPLASLLVICAASAGSVTAAMLLGRGLAALLPPALASRLGAFAIIGIGLFFLLQFLRQRIRALEEDGSDHLLSFKIKPLGIIVRILKEPSSADFDRSGEIGAREAFFLGLALATDAFGAGIGIAMAGYSILFTAIAVGMLKFILVGSGLLLGRRVAGERWQSLSAAVTAVLLLAIGISELVR